MTDLTTGPTRRRCLAWLALAPLAPRAHALGADAAVQQLMTQTYGRPQRASGGWSARYQDNDYRLLPVATRLVPAPGGTRLYVFVNGDLADERAADMMTPGVVGALAYEDRGGQWARLAATPLLAAGGYGHGPGRAELVQLGPDHYHGWVYETNAMGQGHVWTWRTVIAPLGQRYARLAMLLAAQDNEGAYDCEGRAPDARCESQVCEMTVDRADAAARVWPLQVRRTGRRGGRAIPERQWRLAFDTRRWQYGVPPELRWGA